METKQFWTIAVMGACLGWTNLGNGQEPAQHAHVVKPAEPIQSAVQQSPPWLVSKAATCSCATACICPPRLSFEADWLYLDRNNDGIAPNKILGTYAQGLNDLDFSRESGYRLRGTVALWNWDIEGVYSRLDPWNAASSGSVNGGISFDTGWQTGNPWAGTDINYLNSATLFSPIFDAATSAGATDEFDGFGPNTGFADANPTFALSYRSELDMAEFNIRPGNYIGGLCGTWRVGAGYAHVSLDEAASASLAGTFRAADTGGGPFSGGLSHSDLTDPNAGNLTHLSGGANGFDDESVPGGPDTLSFTYDSTTRNSMNGFQMIYDRRFYQSRRILLDGALKLGVYDNHVRGAVSERYTETTADNSVYGRDFTDDTHRVAYAGTLSLGAGFGITNRIMFRTGYEVTLIDGVALAPDQVVRDNGYNVNADGSLILHGLRLGIEGRY